MMTKASFLRYQDKPFLGSSHWWAIKIIKKINTPVRVLDVGPGNGLLGRVLVAELGLKADAVEIDQATRERLGPSYNRLVASLDELASQRYDLILLLDVLEHVPDHIQFFQKIRDRLAPGGRILLSVPNIAHWSIRLALLLGYFNYQDRGILDRTHLHFFTRSSLRSFIQDQAQLAMVSQDVSIEPLELCLPRALWEHGSFRLLSRFRLKLARCWPGLLAYQHLVELK